MQIDFAFFFFFFHKKKKTNQIKIFKEAFRSKNMCVHVCFEMCLHVYCTVPHIFSSCLLPLRVTDLLDLVS